MTRCLAFIELNPLFFVLHRLQQRLRLLLTHLALLFRLRLGGLCVFRRFLGLVLIRRFNFAG
jgi:hypothetical protein